MSLAVPDGDLVLNVDQITGPRSIVSASWVGRPTPYQRTSNGRVLVAFLREAERERRLSSPLTLETPNTIVEPDILRALFAEVRARGYAQTVDEHEKGLNAAAAPVRRADGEVTASRRLAYVERSQSVGSQ